MARINRGLTDDKERQRALNSARKAISRRMSKKQAEFAKWFPVSDSVTAAAVKAGYSKASAHEMGVRNLEIPEVANQIEREYRNLAQSFEHFGAHSDFIAKHMKHLVDYNSEKVLRPVGIGKNTKEIEEMRDSKVVASTLVQIAKLSGSSLENARSTIINEVNNDTAFLAIKSLLQKLTADQVKQVMEACEMLLDRDIRVVDEGME